MKSKKTRRGQAIRSTPSLGSVGRTARGFETVEFKDRYGVPCSLQASSLAEYTKPGMSAVWLGCDDADPRIMAKDAAAHGVTTGETCGWVKYPVPEAVLLNTRMHLDRKQVEALIVHLQRWLRRGTFGKPNPSEHRPTGPAAGSS